MNPYYEDFQRWCRECVTITDKLSGARIPFILNAPQQRVAALMEQQRKAGKPIRLIMLKARQWGGSTLVQTYMAWMQMVRHKGWNSIICAHVKDASANIRGMYSLLLRDYPEHLKEGNPKEWAFTPFEKSLNVNQITARDCRVAVASAQAPNAVRGGNYQMAHLSETAFWGDGDWEAAEQIVRTIGGTVAREPETLVVMESTANGTGNYFHHEWQRAVEGKSDKIPVFVPWHEIEIYTRPVSDDERDSLLASLDEYETSLLLHHGVSLPHLAWYHDKRREYATHAQMMAEYPSTPEEAFCSVASPLFSAEECDKLDHAALSAEKAAEESDPTLCLAPRFVCPDPLEWKVVALLPGTITPCRHIICLGGICNGKIVVERMTEVNGALGFALQTAIKVGQRHGGQLLFVDNTADGSGRCGWLVRRALSEGVSLCCDSSEEAVSTVTSRRLTEMADTLRELISESRLLILCPLTRREIRSLGALRPGVYAATGKDRAAAALALAEILASRMHTEPLTLADFI